MQAPISKANARIVQQFHSQRVNENVLLETRQHWWAWVRWLPVPILMALAGIGGALLIPPIGGLFVVIGLVFGLAFTLYLYADWINDSIIITDQRIVRITRNLLRFSQQVSEIPLSSIQEINADIPNWDLFALAFNYGFIALKTSGQAGDIKLSMIPDPDGVQDLILTDFNQRQIALTSSEQDEVKRNIERMVTPNNASHEFGRLPREIATTARRAPWSPWIQTYPGADGATVYRRHWYVWVKHTWLPMLALVGAFVSLIVLQAAGLGIIGCGITFMIAVISGAWFWWVDQDFRNDYMIVNDNTITMLHQRPLWLKNERDVLLLKRVDNIIAESQGFFNQMLNKGTLRFALIGGSEFKEFRDIYNPLGVQAALTRRQGIARKNTADEANQQQQALIGQYITAYHEMMEKQGQPQATAYSPVPYMPPTSPVAPYPPAQTPANPRPNLTQGRPYAPQMPIQPPPYQMPTSPVYPGATPYQPQPPLTQPPSGYPPQPPAYPPQGSYPPPQAPEPRRAAPDFPPPPGVKPRPRS